MEVSPIVFIACIIFYIVSALLVFRYGVRFIDVLMFVTPIAALALPLLVVVDPWSSVLIPLMLPFGIHIIEAAPFMGFMLFTKSVGLIVIAIATALSVAIGCYFVIKFSYKLFGCRSAVLFFVLYVLIIILSAPYRATAIFAQYDYDRWAVASFQLKMLSMVMLTILPIICAIPALYILYKGLGEGFTKALYQDIKNVVLISLFSTYIVGTILLAISRGKMAHVGVAIALLVMFIGTVLTMKFYDMLSVEEMQDRTIYEKDRIHRVLRSVYTRIKECADVAIPMLLLLIILPIVTASIAAIEYYDSMSKKFKVIEVDIDDLPKLKNLSRRNQQYIFADKDFVYKLTVLEAMNMSARLLDNGTPVIYIENSNNTKSFIYKKVKWIEHPSVCPGIFEGVLGPGEKRLVCVTDVRYLTRDFGGPLEIVGTEGVDIWFKSEERYLIVFSSTRKPGAWNLMKTPAGWSVCYPEIEGLVWRCYIWIPTYFIHMKLSIETNITLP